MSSHKKLQPREVIFQGNIYNYIENQHIYEYIDPSGYKSTFTEEFANSSELVKPFPEYYTTDSVEYDNGLGVGLHHYTGFNTIYSDELSTNFNDSNSLTTMNRIANLYGQTIINKKYSWNNSWEDINEEKIPENKPAEQPKVDTTNYPRIQIEKMLFGDFRVQVWDKSLNSLLDREYFCCGFNSALQTAMSVKLDSNHQDFKDLPIYLYQDNKEKKLYD